MSAGWPALVVCLLAALGAAACQEDTKDPARVIAARSPVVTSASKAAPLVASGATLPHHAPGDDVLGKQLIERFECHRCHAGPGLPQPQLAFACVGCHRKILAGEFQAPEAKLAEWSPHVRAVRAAPSLHGAAARLRYAWVVEFLKQPHDLRPGLAPTMPRLPLTMEQARAIATHLVGDAVENPAAHRPIAMDREVDGGDIDRGRSLVEARGCGSCHVVSGAQPLPSTPDLNQAHQDDRILLAPDLGEASRKLQPATLVAFLKAPRSVKPDALMPALGLTDPEARDIVAYLLALRRPAPVLAPPPPRLPVLERRVAYPEVEARVFGKTCRHCHGNPDIAMGDGGPGNTGGLGFPGRKLSFASYRDIMAGYVDDDGRRRSLFEKDEAGVSHLVRSLVARHEEERGDATGPIRGMPLGLPALLPEDIQLVESWVAQGRPR